MSDPIVVVISAVVAYGIRFPLANWDFPQDYKALMLLGFLCVAWVFPLFNLYSSWRGKSLIRQANVIILAWGTVVLCMIVILFGLKVSSDFSRLWLGWWMFLGLGFLLFYRMCLYGFLHYQRKQGRNFRRVLIVGAGGLGGKLVYQTKESPWAGFKIEALFDDSPDLQGTIKHGCKVQGNLDAVSSYVEKNQIDEIWIALPLRAEKRVKELLYGLRHQTVNVKLVPDIFVFSLLNHSMTDILGLPAVNLSDTPMGGGNRIIKALEDKLLGISIFILITPVLVLIAIILKLTTTGPILFKQKRHGWDGRIINVYKFCTMKQHSEVKGQLTQAKKGDSRITSFGAFLRSTSLDELPQFYNVLQGRMSIVGPRPHATQHNELYKDQVEKYMLRHMVKPGITGWAQVNGLRGETDTLDKMKKRVEYDLFYIENWSLWFDLKIIVLTIYKGFVHKNAH